MTEAATEEAGAVAPAEPTYDFGESIQSQIVAYLLRDTQFLVRTTDLVKPEYYDGEENAAIARTALEHFQKYKEAPGAALPLTIKRAVEAKKIRKDLVPGIRDKLKAAIKAELRERESLIDEVAVFARNRAVEKAIVASAEIVGKGDYDKIRKIMNEALSVGSYQEGITYDYWREIDNRTTRRKELMAGTRLKTGITTGCKEFDDLLYHGGWGRKELSVMMGGPKAGKSMSLGDFGKMASLAGKNAIYFSLEVGAEIIADRVDASVSDLVIKMVGTNPFTVETAVKAAHSKAGEYIIEEYATGSLKASHIRRRLDYYRARGVMFDLIIVDYGDLMMPEYRAEDTRENLRTIFVDLRAIAFEENAAMLTATQTNREGAKSAISKMTDVAEDFNKVRTADVLISINSTEAERLAGECRLFFAASRNSEDGFILRIKSDRSKMQFLKGVIGKEGLS